MLTLPAETYKKLQYARDLLSPIARCFWALRAVRLLWAGLHLIKLTSRTTLSSLTAAASATLVTVVV